MVSVQRWKEESRWKERDREREIERNRVSIEQETRRNGGRGRRGERERERLRGFGGLSTMEGEGGGKEEGGKGGKEERETTTPQFLSHAQGLMLTRLKSTTNKNIALREKGRRGEETKRETMDGHRRERESKREQKEWVSERKRYGRGGKG